MITPDDFLDRFGSKIIASAAHLRNYIDGFRIDVVSLTPREVHEVPTVLLAEKGIQWATRKCSHHVGLATSVGLTQTLEPSGELMNSIGIYVRFS